MLNPDTHSYSQFKSCTWTNFWLRPTLNRDTAPVPFHSFIYRDYFPAVYQTCTATPPALRFGGQSAPACNKTCTRTAKSTPCSPLPSIGTITISASCYHDRRRATQPPFIAGPLALMRGPLLINLHSLNPAF
jgi:hypothetical protein